MSHSRDGPGVTAPLRTNIVPLTRVWNPPPSVTPLKKSLRGPAAILFISRDTCSDSIAKLFRAGFNGVSHNYRAIRCKMGYRTSVPV